MSQKKALTPLSMRLKQAKERGNLTAEQIADRLDVSPAAVRHWWTARNYPPYNVLERYAEVCGVSVYWLITGKPDQEEVVDRLYRALEAFRGAVVAGEEPLPAWERILGRKDILTEEERRRLTADPIGLRAYLTSLDGVEWVTLTPEQHRVVHDLVRLLALPPSPPAPTTAGTNG